MTPPSGKAVPIPTSWTVPKRFKRDFDKKPRELQAAIIECINRLRENPQHPGLRVHRVKGSSGVWEAYVDEANRVTFGRPGAGQILLLNHCNHDIIKMAK